MIPIALQLYSVRNDAKQDLFGVLRRVKAMGYDGVEFAGYHGHAAADIKRVLDETGLKAAGTHVGLGEFAPEKLEATVDFHRTLGCENLIVPWLPEDRRNTRAATEATAKELTDVAQRLRPHGMRTGFHAHAADMKPIDGQRSAWDILAENTPREFVLEYDTANGMDGGADPVAPIEAHPGRGLLTHLKEFHRNGGHGKGAIGEGDVPWGRVLAACEKAGTRWYVIEQEGHPTLSAMEVAERSLVNLKKLMGQ